MWSWGGPPQELPTVQCKEKQEETEEGGNGALSKPRTKRVQPTPSPPSGHHHAGPGPEQEDRSVEQDG